MGECCSTNLTTTGREISVISLYQENQIKKIQASIRYHLSRRVARVSLKGGTGLVNRDFVYMLVSENPKVKVSKSCRKLKKG